MYGDYLSGHLWYFSSIMVDFCLMLIRVQIKDNEDIKIHDCPQHAVPETKAYGIIVACKN